MAHYQEVDYCSEEVRSVASPAGFGRHGGVQQHGVTHRQPRPPPPPRPPRPRRLRPLPGARDQGRGGHQHLHGRGPRAQGDLPRPLRLISCFTRAQLQRRRRTYLDWTGGTYRIRTCVLPVFSYDVQNLCARSTVSAYFAGLHTHPVSVCSTKISS
ncbi:hypothetical protein PVAP13_5NG012603 [Panicum virgatum]|uniref:Uncharacterized protein n=1 Tax=Panicum virgatum TaxID=38727 RepID=A0A8T0SBE8_PANVG|nr:hypothetical protein PVAP13_5NG012603 [Panicum virgatum]